MPTAMYSIYATVGLHVTVPRMPVLQLYESLIVIVSESVTRYLILLPLILRNICHVCSSDLLRFSVGTYVFQD